MKRFIVNRFRRIFCKGMSRWVVKFDNDLYTRPVCYYNAVVLAKLYHGSVFWVGDESAPR